MKKTLLATALVASTGLAPAIRAAETEQPNILIIFPDDVGWTNVSAYGRGVIGYETPNIDRLANEGIMFTEHYA